MNTDQARHVLQEHGLRATAPRLTVLCALAHAQRPLSHSEVVTELQRYDWDPATIYRNLIKLRDAGVTSVVSRVDGTDRYAFDDMHGEGHQHPHFVCEECGRIACLPAELTASITMSGLWATSIQNAVVQLRGACPDCITRAPNT